MLRVIDLREQHRDKSKTLYLYIQDLCSVQVSNMQLIEAMKKNAMYLKQQWHSPESF